MFVFSRQKTEQHWIHMTFNPVNNFIYQYLSIPILQMESMVTINNSSNLPVELIAKDSFSAWTCWFNTILRAGVFPESHQNRVHKRNENECFDCAPDPKKKQKTYSNNDWFLCGVMNIEQVWIYINISHLSENRLPSNWSFVWLFCAGACTRARAQLSYVFWVFYCFRIAAEAQFYASSECIMSASFPLIPIRLCIQIEY